MCPAGPGIPPDYPFMNPQKHLRAFLLRHDLSWSFSFLDDPTQSDSGRGRDSSKRQGGGRNQDFKIAIFVDAIANRSVFFGYITARYTGGRIRPVPGRLLNYRQRYAKFRQGCQAIFEHSVEQPISLY